MTLSPTNIDGAFIIDVQRHTDARGAFFRHFDSHAFADRGLTTLWDYFSTATNIAAGTLRGMHYQAEPHGETKLVRCIRGSVFDVAIDLRPASLTYLKWHGVQLSAMNERCFYIPVGCAHGYLTLENDSDVTYLIAGAYTPAAGRGVRWDDPACGVHWPSEVKVIIERDAHYANFIP